MPELPEVETIVRHLHPKLLGKRILSVEVRGQRVLRYHQNPKEFVKSIVGGKVQKISRLGKNIIFELSGGTRFVLHLMMTGRLLLNPEKNALHDRLILYLSGGHKLVFNDVRQFGWCWAGPLAGNRTARGQSDFPQLNLGPDAPTLKFKKFKSLIYGHSGAIKNILLNQKIIAGIGNIYSDEILWYAGIKPTRKSDSLFKKEVRALYASMRKVLTLAIKKGGTSSRDYRKPDGSEGGYYKIRKAYQRDGERCSRCGGIIRRIRISQRSAHYCSQHQR